MKTGITFRDFDLLHAGHVKMVEETKLHCDQEGFLDYNLSLKIPSKSVD